MGERSYLKGYVKALDPSIKTKGKSKSWLRGFIDSYYDNNTKINGCSSKSQNSIFGNGCGKNKQVPSACQSNQGYPMNDMLNGGMMSMINNIVNRLISIIQQQMGNQTDINNIYNTYNSYPTSNYNTYNTKYDNDIINNNINGAGNSIFVDA